MVFMGSLPQQIYVLNENKFKNSLLLDELKTDASTKSTSTLTLTNNQKTNLTDFAVYESMHVFFIRFDSLVNFLSYFFNLTLINRDISNKI